MTIVCPPPGPQGRKPPRPASSLEGLWFRNESPSLSEKRPIFGFRGSGKPHVARGVSVGALRADLACGSLDSFRRVKNQFSCKMLAERLIGQLHANPFCQAWRGDLGREDPLREGTLELVCRP
eukprot:3643002-Prymnesium_polylepis.1